MVGLAADQARYAAQRALSNAMLLKEQVRETWGAEEGEAIRCHGARGVDA